MKIPLARPVINEEMIEAAVNALQNEKLVLGESVFKFEEEFAKYFGVKYAVSVNSGNTALLFAFQALGVDGASEVIGPSATFIATMNGAVLLGADPVFADIDMNTYTIDPEDVKKKITEKTKVIVPVHLYGYPADMEKLMEISEETGIPILEDCAQAHGAEYRGKKVGTFGEVAIFSFYPTKNMTVGGDGGMVITNNEEIAELVKKLRDNGRKSKNTHDIIGHTARLNTVNAAIGRVQLKYLDEWNEKRRKIASIYDKILDTLDEVVTPPKPSSSIKPVYHLYVIRVPENKRNLLGAWLEKNGIQTAVHYPIPIHLQPAYARFGYKEGDLPITEKWAKTVLSIPMFVEMTKDQAKYVGEKIYEFFDKRVYENNKELEKEAQQWIKRLM
ncbi:DegT/DnrJ/EryC1/StrS family aminotransferase [Pyrococcus kukulkanii]|uniref:DegT/DnrJ/EryC1/StrS family aminotransferase n=1 Tax=Pyrococcus kukulkanii TaxID=1609559 RepID=UPI0008376469|nr:DegT/DnrJ/EryC1/StrS family aminotransferase [Pyrococcus kukulkanii]